MPTLFTAPQLPQHGVVEHAGVLYIVPLRPGGWTERVPYKGHRRALQPWALGAEQTLATIGYQARSGEAARSGPSGPTIPDAQRRRPPINVTLAPETLAALDGLVSSGAYPSRSAAVEAAVQMLLAHGAGLGDG